MTKPAPAPVEEPTLWNWWKEYSTQPVNEQLVLRRWYGVWAGGISAHITWHSAKHVEVKMLDRDPHYDAKKGTPLVLLSVHYIHDEETGKFRERELEHK